MDLSDWDEAGQVSNGTFFPEPLALRPLGLWDDEDQVTIPLPLGTSEEEGMNRDASSFAGSYGDSVEKNSVSSSVQGAGEKRETSEEEKQRKRAIVAAASRATRLKRKREREQLAERNKKLEKDRDVYLGKIAQLQTEVQMLRDGGAINLEKENELLRTEIRKHKAFIFSIVNATKAVPNTTEEEKYRLVKHGSDSAVGQVIGLAYTSVADPSWRSGSLPLPCGESLPVRYQLLPLGCSNIEAKRVNLRLDMPDRPEDVPTLRDKIFKTWTDPALVRRLVEGISDSRTTADLKEIETDFANMEKDSTSNNIRVFHYTEKDIVKDIQEEALPDGAEKNTDKEESVTRDSIFVLTWKWTRTFDHAFPHLVGSDSTSYAFETVETADPESTCVLSSATTINEQEHLRAEQDGVLRINSPMIEGHILRRKPDGGSKWSVLMTVPVDKHSYVGLCPDKFGPLVNEDGSLGPTAQRTMSTVLQLVEEQ